jgi:hypothetical protein
MRIYFDQLSMYLRFIRALSLLVPAAERWEWRREWEAEIVHRWQALQKWNRLNLKSKFDLTARVAGATRDVASFQQKRTRMVLAVLNILVALALGFGAMQEFVFRGLDGQLQPFFLSSAAIVVSILFIVSAAAMLRQWPSGRRLVLVTGGLSILIHVYGALPPHRNMGYLALLIGAGYAFVMMLAYQRNSRRNPIT